MPCRLRLNSRLFLNVLKIHVGPPQVDVCDGPESYLRSRDTFSRSGPIESSEGEARLEQPG